VREGTVCRLHLARRTAVRLPSSLSATGPATSRPLLLLLLLTVAIAIAIAIAIATPTTTTVLLPPHKYPDLPLSVAGANFYVRPFLFSKGCRVYIRLCYKLGCTLLSGRETASVRRKSFLSISPPPNYQPQPTAR
jgi:hypothetical protein